MKAASAGAPVQHSESSSEAATMRAPRPIVGDDCKVLSPVSFERELTHRKAAGIRACKVLRYVSAVQATYDGIVARIWGIFPDRRRINKRKFSKYYFEH